MCSTFMYFPQAVFEVDKTKGLVLTEVFEGVSVEDIRAATGCQFQVSDNLKPMAQI